MSEREAKPVTPCLICGYDLAGLPEEGNCPECGAPVAQADGALFRSAGPGLLQQLVEGSRLALLASWARAGLQLLWGFAFAVIPEQLEAFSAASVLSALLDLVVAGMAALGWWRVAAQPPWAAHDGMEARRRFLRPMVVVFFAVSIVAGIAGQIGSAVITVDPTGTSYGPGTVIMGALGVFAGIASLLTYIAGVRFLAPFCRRLGDDRLSRMARHLRWTIPLAFIIMASLAALIASFVDRRLQALLESLIFVALYYAVWVRFLILLHRRIRRLAEQDAQDSPTVPNAPETESPAL